MAEAPLTVVARAKAKVGREAELERELRALVNATHREPGCLHYTIHRAIADPTLFIAIERWASREAMAEHLAAPYVQALLQKAAEILSAPPEITVFESLPEGQPEKGSF